MQRQERADYNLIIEDCIRKYHEEQYPENKKAAGISLAEYIHHRHRAEWLLTKENSANYTAILQTLMTNRKAKGIALTGDELDIVLSEGVRLLVPSILKYYILRQLTGEEPVEVLPRGRRQIKPKLKNHAEIREGCRAAANWARHLRDNFLLTLVEDSVLKAIDPNAYQTERAYMRQLAVLCRSEYFVLNAPITQDMQRALAMTIQEIEVINVFQIADDLQYPKLYLMLAQHYAERVKEKHEHQAEIDHVMRAYKALQQRNQYSHEIKEVIQSIDKPLVEMSKARLKNQTPSGLTQSYRSIAADNHGREAVVSKLTDLEKSDPVETFSAALNYYLCVLPYPTAVYVLKDLIDQLQSKDSRDILRNAMRTLGAVKEALGQYPQMLQYCYLVEGGSPMMIEYNDQQFNVNPVSFDSIYMLITKTFGEADNYKFYLAFNPTDAGNYAKCWEALVNNVLMHDNVYGVKMVSPKEAVTAYEFPGYEDKSKHSGQPGKMAIVYFKRYEDVKPTKGEDYSEEDYRKENNAVMKKLEAKLTALRVTKNKEQVLPDHSLPMPFDSNDNPYTYVSGDTGGEGKDYIVSDERAVNRREENPCLQVSDEESSEALLIQSESEPALKDDVQVVPSTRQRKRDVAKYAALLFGGIVFATALTFLIVSTAGVSVPVVAVIVGATAAAFNATVLATSIGLICATALGAIGFGAGYIWTAYNDHKKQKAQLVLEPVSVEPAVEPVVEPAPAVEAASGSTRFILQATLDEAAPEQEPEQIEVQVQVEDQQSSEKLNGDSVTDSREEAEPPKMKGDDSALEEVPAPAEKAQQAGMGCSLM